MATGKISDIVLMDGVGLSHAIKAKQVSCLEVMTAYLDHIDVFNPRSTPSSRCRRATTLLAEASERDAQLARGEYLGWMHGFPHAVKDNMPVKGMPFTRGSPLFKDFIAPADAIVVERMRAAGRDHHRQDQPAGVRARVANPQPRVRNDPQSLRPEQDLRRVERWRGRRGRAAHAAGRERHRSYNGSLRNPGAFNNVFALRPAYGRVPAEAPRRVQLRDEHGRTDGAHSCGPGAASQRAVRL